MSEQTIKNLTEQRDELLSACEMLRDVVVRQNNLGASGHQEVFPDLIQALALCNAAIEKVKRIENSGLV